MLRWNMTLGANGETPEKVEKFLSDLMALYEKHGLSIGHEDGQGAFIIRPRNDMDESWINDAFIETPEPS